MTMMGDVPDDMWGCGIVIFEAQRAAFPLGFPKPILPPELLTEFDTSVQQYCETNGTVLSDQTTIDFAATITIRILENAIQHGFSDGDDLIHALLLLTHFSTYQYWFLRIKEDGAIFFAQLRADSMESAHESMIGIVNAFAKNGQELRIYVGEPKPATLH